jgi:hypothetical protein
MRLIYITSVEIFYSEKLPYPISFFLFYYISSREIQVPSDRLAETCDVECYL